MATQVAKQVVPLGSSDVVTAAVVSGCVRIAFLGRLFGGFKYTVEASVHSDADGNVSGQIHVRVLDLSAFGVAPYDVEGVPTCMRVVGNTAYIGEVITKTTDPVNAPVGELGVFWVRDGGPNGADVGHEGPSWFYDPTGLICTDTPPAGLTPDPITHGNFVVR